MYCPNCNKETVENAMFCAGCGAGLTGGQPAKKTRWSTAAGILDIVAGVSYILGLVFAVTVMLFVMHVGGEVQGGFVLLFPIGGAVMSILAIVGGIFALRRKNRAMALAGATGAALTLSPFGVAALILTVMGRDEFE
jgi:hypothetical protein